ncbi:MAG: thioesterase family protein [Acidimicrobiia bacterium]
MASHVAVMGSGARAAGWATRFLAAGLDVVVADANVPDEVVRRWPSAQRLGLFPGADLARLRVSTDDADIASGSLVQVVGNTASSPVGATLVATDRTALAFEPIQLLPLVELAEGPDRDRLRDFYAGIGMAPRSASTPAEERWRLGPGLAALAEGDPDAIIAVMRSLRPSGRGAGAVLAAHEARRLTARAIRPWQPGDPVPAPLRLYEALVEPEWVDYNGHMTEAAYLTAAGWASDALFRYIGDDEAYRAAGHSFYTVETHIHFLREVDVHEPLAFDTQVLGVDAKRVHLVHSMHHGASGTLLSTVEQMLVHVDMAAGRSTPTLPEVAAALAAIADAHAALPQPPGTGSVMQLPPPSTTH